MKTLYVSDLDGTLLNSKQEISDYTKQVIEKYVEQGMLFSYATARSYYSAKPVTQNLKAKIPVILYNGAFIMDSQTQDILVSNFFSQKEKEDLAAFFYDNHFYPIVYSFINKQEKFSYDCLLSTKQQLSFVETRNDIRKHPIKSSECLFDGEVFYISCIASKDILDPFYKKLKDRYQCLYSQDIYSHDWWLEILPQQASKANAVMQLKQYLDCDKVIVFGDGLNDMSMFEIADECYALENACEQLKKKATRIIGHHDEDALAKWLEEHVIK